MGMHPSPLLIQQVNRAARLMSAALGGQVVCERGIMEDVVRDWRQRASAAAMASGQVQPQQQEAGEGEGVTLSPTIRAGGNYASAGSSPTGVVARSPRPHLSLTVPPAPGDETPPGGDLLMTPQASPSPGELRVARSFMGATGSFTK